jgi:hypothetical protein
LDVLEFKCGAAMVSGALSDTRGKCALQVMVEVVKGCLFPLLLQASWKTSANS